MVKNVPTAPRKRAAGALDIPTAPVKKTAISAETSAPEIPTQETTTTLQKKANVAREIPKAVYKKAPVRQDKSPTPLAKTSKKPLSLRKNPGASQDKIAWVRDLLRIPQKKAPAPANKPAGLRVKSPISKEIPTAPRKKLASDQVVSQPAQEKVLASREIPTTPRNKLVAAPIVSAEPQDEVALPWETSPQVQNEIVLPWETTAEAPNEIALPCEIKPKAQEQTEVALENQETLGETIEIPPAPQESTPEAVDAPAEPPGTSGGWQVISIDPSVIIPETQNNPPASTGIDGATRIPDEPQATIPEPVRPPDAAQAVNIGSQATPAGSPAGSSADSSVKIAEELDIPTKLRIIIGDALSIPIAPPMRKTGARKIPGVTPKGMNDGENGARREKKRRRLVLPLYFTLGWAACLIVFLVWMVRVTIPLLVNVSLHSVLRSDYSADPRGWNFPALDFNIILDALQDHDPSSAHGSYATLISMEQTPVATVTPNGTITPFSSPGFTPTQAAAATPTPPPSPTATPTPSASPSQTLIPSATPFTGTPTPSNTLTQYPGSSGTPTPRRSATPTRRVTSTQPGLPTETNTPRPATSTPQPTSTRTQPPAPTDTRRPTRTRNPYPYP